MESASKKSAFFSCAIFVILSIIGFSLVWSFLLAISTFWPMKLLFKKREVEKRKKEFDDSLGEGLQIISNSLRAGLTLKDSLKASLVSSPLAFKNEIELILQDIQIGIPMAQALEQAKIRVDTDNAGLAFGSMIISTKTGGDLPTMLERIIHTVGQRERIRGKLNALTAQGRMQAALVCSAPPLLFFFMYWFDKSRIQLLLDQTLGQILLALAVLLEVIGIFVTKKVMKLNL
jgi:tight adherence protein B